MNRSHMRPIDRCCFAVGRSERQRAYWDTDTTVVRRGAVDWVVIGAMYNIRYFYSRMDRHRKKKAETSSSEQKLWILQSCCMDLWLYIHGSRHIIVVLFCCAELFAWVQFLCRLNLSDTTLRLLIEAMFLIISPQKSLLIIRMSVYDPSLEQVPCPQLQWFSIKPKAPTFYSLLYKNFTSNKVPYSSRIYYCTTFQFSKVSGVTVAPASQVRASAVLLLLIGCSRRTTLGWCQWCT
jgi:hypothetical protein